MKASEQDGGQCRHLHLGVCLVIVRSYLVRSAGFRSSSYRMLVYSFLRVTNTLLRSVLVTLGHRRVI